MNDEELIATVEDIYGCELLEWQKKFVLNVCKARKEHKRLYYIPPRGNSKFNLEYLQAIVICLTEGVIDKGKQ